MKGKKKKGPFKVDHSLKKSFKLQKTKTTKG